MTLITNEIHIFNGLDRSTLVFAADRRLTKPDGSYAATRRKLFKIPYLRAGISYFGLAVVQRGKQQYMSDWLRVFIMHHSGLSSLRDFASELRDQLHNVIPPDVLGRNPSGFHICGYNSHGLPEFWYLSNIGGMSGFAYTNIQPRYGDPTEDFLARDAKSLAGTVRIPRPLKTRPGFTATETSGHTWLHLNPWTRF